MVEFGILDPCGVLVVRWPVLARLLGEPVPLRAVVSCFPLGVAPRFDVRVLRGNRPMKGVICTTNHEAIFRMITVIRLFDSGFGMAVLARA